MTAPTKTTIIFLSDTPDTAGEKVGTIDAPVRMVGKFILINGPDEFAMAYGPIDDYGYHADLVKRFCDLSDIPSGWAKKPDMYEILTDSYRVIGGGWFEENISEKTVRFYGYSTAYGGFDRQDILYLLRTTNSFADYLVDFDD
ncbi:MAG: hypothetical protein AB1483_03420 [Candidatus Zixiibacteriota bacterium]